MAQQLSIQDQQVIRNKKGLNIIINPIFTLYLALKELELLLEKYKVQQKALTDKVQLAQRHGNILMEKKTHMEKMIQQKQLQFSEEQA